MSAKRYEATTAQEFGQLVAFLARNGVAAQSAREVIGNAPQGRTRQEIADALRAWLRELPKG